MEWIFPGGDSKKGRRWTLDVIRDPRNGGQWAQGSHEEKPNILIAKSGGITGLAYCGNKVGLGEREKPANPFGNGRKRRHC